MQRKDDAELFEKVARVIHLVLLAEIICAGIAGEINH